MINDLFTCHVMDWRKIRPNQVGGKLFSIVNKGNSLSPNRFGGILLQSTMC